jgi:hypothetical protein
MRALFAMALIALAGCGTTGMNRDGGFATYDALRAGQAQCAAKGEHFKLKRNGDPQYIGDYACERQ